MADSISLWNKIWQHQGVRKGAPWLLFGLFLLLGWRSWWLAGHTPAYGDIGELMAAVEWYREALASPDLTLAYSPRQFHPFGWYTYSQAQGPVVIWLLLLLSAAGGFALAYNLLALSSLALAFAGMRRLAGRQLPAGAALVAGLLFAFWGFHWLRLYGHLNILLGSALLPWLIILVDQALADSAGRRRRLVAAGGVWAVAVASSLQFVWLGGFLVLGWVGGRWLARRGAWRPALLALLLPAVIAAGLNAPYIIAFRRAQAAAGAPFYNIRAQIDWSASLNAFAAPAPWHPWLAGWARWLYTGPVRETAFVGFGTLGALTALLLVWRLRRARAWWPFLLVAGVGIVLALGPYLQWGGEVVTVDLFQPVNAAVWRLGNFLKPDFFFQTSPPPPLATGIPLPGLGLGLFLPFWEGGRTVVRYAAIAAIGIFPLLGAAVARLPRRWQRLLLAGLLLIEVVPWVLPAVPFLPPAHPAQQWVAANTAAEAGILNLFVPAPDQLALSHRGEIQASAWLHQRANVTGPIGVLPRRTAALAGWLRERPAVWTEPEFSPLLREYEVDYVLLHLSTPAARDVAAAWLEAGPLPLLACFPPPAGESPWAYDICVYEGP